MRYFSVLAASLLSGVLTGCGDAPPRPIVIGINPWPGYELLYLAAEKGIWARHGLSIELKEFSSLGDVRRAYERGLLDGMACTMVEVLQTREESAREPQVALLLDYSNGADVILARPGIHTVAQLAGRRVGAETASLGTYMLHRAAERAGVRMSDMRVEAFDQMAMEGAIRQQRLDAVVTYPPVSLRVARLGWKPVFDSSAIPGEIADVLAIDKAVLAANRGLQSALLESARATHSYLAQNRRDAVEVMAAREGISPAEFEESLRLVSLVHAPEMTGQLGPGGEAETVLLRLNRVLREAGQIQGPDRTGDAVAYVRLRAAAGAAGKEREP